MCTGPNAMVFKLCARLNPARFVSYAPRRLGSLWHSSLANDVFLEGQRREFDEMP